jgi:hypothetical protein
MGFASFIYTERDFIAVYRALRIATNPSYDTFITRLGVIFLGHVLLLAGIEVLVLWAYGAKGENGPIPWQAAAFSAGLAIAGGWVLYSRIYGYRRRLRAGYRAFPLRDEKVNYQFTPLRFAFQHRLAEGSSDWSVIPQVTEFRDGFLIHETPRSGHWVPKYAFGESFGEIDAANLLRSRVGRYRVIDRSAGLPEKTRHRKP